MPRWVGTSYKTRVRFHYNSTSTPLFLFLALRWSWRYVIWGVLLFRIARLPQQLDPPQANRASGLGFLSLYPGIFGGFALAMSCVVSAAMVKELHYRGHAIETLWLAMAGWVLFCLALLIGPLLVFTRPPAPQRVLS